MAVKQKLQQTQSVAYRTIENGFLRNKTSHAYLLCGSEGSPLKEMGVFLAQSFLCENKQPLACEACLTCIRVEDYNYIDFTFIDGSNGTIKKDFIDDLQADFSKTALEVAGVKVYLIHLIENASMGAINGILKFLEEPSDNVVGILTTHNVSKILPTIVSRCQMIRLKNPSKQHLAQEVHAKGHSLEDATLLAQHHASAVDMETILNNENFHQVKDLAMESFHTFVRDPQSIHYWIQRNAIPRINQRADLYVYLQILETLFRDVTNRDTQERVIFKDQIPLYRQADTTLDWYRLIEKIMYAKGSLDSNVNAGLALDRLYYEMMQRQ